MSYRLIWERDGRDWPNRAFSRFVTAGGLRWHVQVAGQGPVVLLVHGTGAATHTWRGLLPLLKPYFTVVAPDLPGHGFTDPPATPAGYALPAVAQGVTALLRTLGLSPALVAGHSAGAAILARMCLDSLIRPTTLVSLNGALLPFPGMSDPFFAPVARMVATSAFTAQLFSFFAGNRSGVERLIRSTGSKIDSEGLRLYGRLVASPGHVAGALGLMAAWDLRPLLRDLPRLAAKLVLVVGSNDQMVPPAQARQVQKLVPSAELVTLPGLGHLAHEEAPDQIAALLRRLGGA